MAIIPLPDGKQTAVKSVIAFIEKEISEGRFVPGCQLPTEGELASAIGVSRTPLREAIKVLEAAGVLEIRRGVGTFLSRQAGEALRHLLVFQSLLKETTPRKLFETRLMIERAAAQLAAQNRTEDDIVRLRAANERFRAVAIDPAASLEECTRADIEFHDVLYAICRNELIGALGGFVTALFAPWIRESLHRGGGAVRAAQNHDLVIAMIEARNEGGAREAIYDRAVDEGLEYWQRCLEEEEEIQLARRAP